MTITYRKHAQLLDRMAQRLGVDLTEAEARGDLPPEMHHDLVLRCTGCSDPGACEAHLARSEKGAPSFCRNARLLESL